MARLCGCVVKRLTGQTATFAVALPSGRSVGLSNISPILSISLQLLFERADASLDITLTPALYWTNSQDPQSFLLSTSQTPPHQSTQRPVPFFMTFAMSANPRINSVPPQDPDPTSHIHHYLSTFNPHLPRIAQEGYHQFADEQEYGLEEVRSYWQGDGSSSVPDRHALEAGIHAGERDTRTWQGDHDRHRGMEEYKRGRGVYTGGDRRVGRPVSTPPQQRHQKEESIRAVRRDLGRFASVPLQEQSQNGTSTREGVEERAARAPRGRVDGSVHARDETESAHSKLARYHPHRNDL